MATAKLVMTLALASAACRGGAEPREPSDAEAAPASVLQPDRSLLALEQVALTERLRILPGRHWREARDVVVDREGNVFVLDAVVPAHILKFDANGRYLLRVGEDESGSTALQAQRISLSPDWNTLFVVDRATSSVLTFLTLGLGSFSVKVTGGVPVHALGLPAYGEYYLHGWDQALGRSGVYHVRIPIDTLATTYEIAIPFNEPIGRVARSVYFRTAADRQGRLYVGFHDGYPIRVLHPSGETVAMIGIEREPVLRGDEAMAAQIAENLARLREQAPDLPDSLLQEAARPDSLLPIIEELDVDPEGRLWVRTHRGDADGTTPYDVFNERGEFLVRVDVPGEVRATTFGPDGRLVVVDTSRDPAGVVVGYEIRLGPEAAAR